MESKQEWQGKAKGILKSELARRNINYRKLSGKLKFLVITESPENISNKISVFR